MEGTMKINEEVTVGPQPNHKEIYEFGKNGFKTIVNFRAPNEEDQSMTPQAEEQIVKGADMEYLHIPVSMNSLDESLVDQFREQYDVLPKPIFAHSTSGKRALALVMMVLAVTPGKSGEQTLKNAEEMGFECDKPKLIEFVKKYVDTHSD